MNIVGPQSVSLADLMKLGPERLNAMAQGQEKSIAPSYMIISALDAWNKSRQGVEQPVGPKSVAQGVMEQAAPQQAGIAGMMPQQPMQRFSGGGTIEGYDPELEDDKNLGEYIKNMVSGVGNIGLDALLFPPKAVAAGINQGLVRPLRMAGLNTPYIEAGLDRSGAATNYNNWRKRFAGQTEPTKPTAPLRASNLTPQQIENLSRPGASSAASKVAATTTAAPAATAKKAGVAAVAASPLGKYERFNPTERELSKIAVPEIEANAALPEAIKDLIAQRAEATERAKANAMAAGLTSFGAGMVAPGRRGFGAAFAPAAHASLGTMQGIRGEADKEDALLRAKQREMNVAVGEEKRKDAQAMYDRRRAEEERLYGREKDKWKAGHDTTEAQNREALELRRQDIMREGNAIAAAARADANKDRHLGVMRAWLDDAESNIQKEAETIFGKSDTVANAVDPKNPLKREHFIAKRRIEYGIPKMQDLFREGMAKSSGISTLSAPPPSIDPSLMRGRITP